MMEIAARGKRNRGCGVYRRFNHLYMHDVSNTRGSVVVRNVIQHNDVICHMQMNNNDLLLSIQKKVEMVVESNFEITNSSK